MTLGGKNTLEDESNIFSSAIWPDMLLPHATGLESLPPS